MTKDNTTIQERPRSISDEHEVFQPEHNLAKYRAELAEFDMADQQKDELLGILFSIMCHFVQLGQDVKICGQIFETFTLAAQSESGAVDFSYSSNEEKPSTGGPSHE